MQKEKRAEWCKCKQYLIGTPHNCKLKQDNSMQVTNEIRQAFLLAVPAVSLPKFISIAFEATETDELMKWLTLQEKVKFGRELLQLTGGRDLQSDLAEDR